MNAAVARSRRARAGSARREVVGPGDGLAGLAVTNEPVTAPAKAGWAAVVSTGSARRPLASITAWPTWAANPIADQHRADENSAEDRTSSDTGRRSSR